MATPPPLLSSLKEHHANRVKLEGMNTKYYQLLTCTHLGVIIRPDFCQSTMHLLCTQWSFIKASSLFTLSLKTLFVGQCVHDLRVIRIFQAWPFMSLCMGNWVMMMIL